MAVALFAYRQPSWAVVMPAMWRGNMDLEQQQQHETGAGSTFFCAGSTFFGAGSTNIEVRAFAQCCG